MYPCKLVIWHLDDQDDGKALQSTGFLEYIRLIVPCKNPKGIYLQPTANIFC